LCFIVTIKVLCTLQPIQFSMKEPNTLTWIVT